MHYLYIIYSPSKAKYYVGETHSITERIEMHNNHTYHGSFTKIASDWRIALNFECIHKDDALFLEKFIKRMKSKKFILKIIENPAILKNILNQR